MFIKQVTVFIENESGKLSEVLDILNEFKIDIRALSIADTKDYGLLRMIVDKPFVAEKALKEKGYIVKVHDVIAIRINNEPGGLLKALHLLKEYKIDVMYLYAFVSEGNKEKASVMLKVSDRVKALEIFKENGISFINGEEIQELN